MSQETSEEPASDLQAAIVDRQHYNSVQEAIQFANERSAALNWAAEQEGPHQELFKKMALEVDALKAFAESKIEPQDESEEE